MGEYTDTYKYLMEKERELAVYLEELKSQSVADLNAQLVNAKKELFNLKQL